MSKGISETKDVIAFVAALVKVIDSRSDRGKARFINMIPSIVKLTPKAIRAINGVKEIPGEFKDLDDKERKELIEVIKKEGCTLSLVNDKKIIEKILEMLVQFSSILQIFKS